MTVLVKRPRHKTEICRRLHRGHKTPLLYSENQPPDWFLGSCGVKTSWALRFFQNHTWPPLITANRCNEGGRDRQSSHRLCSPLEVRGCAVLPSNQFLRGLLEEYLAGSHKIVFHLNNYLTSAYQGICLANFDRTGCLTSAQNEDMNSQIQPRLHALKKKMKKKNWSVWTVRLWALSKRNMILTQVVFITTDDNIKLSKHFFFF